MTIRIATFNVENLLRRFQPERDRRTGSWVPDPAVGLYDHESEAEARLIERAFQVGVSDDQRQLTAQAIRDTNADVIALQEVDDLRALRYFHDRYLRRAVDEPYEHFALLEGNDSRGIEVAAMSRRGLPIRVMSHASLTYRDLQLYNDDLRRWGAREDDRVFKRDCLEVEVDVSGRLLTLFVCHFKSMGDGRDKTMPIRRAEARAVRRLIEDKYGPDCAGANWLVLGDLNDYREKVRLVREPDGRLRGEVEPAAATGLDPLFADHFAVNLVERLRPAERWTHYYADERELAQLDYILASPGLARANPHARPEIVRHGLPYRVPMEDLAGEGTSIRRYPRIGFDRPKASDHCPVVVALDIPDDGRLRA